MTVHLWEGTAHPRSNIEARATFAKDIYNKDSLFSPRIFVRILMDGLQKTLEYSLNFPLAAWTLAVSSVFPVPISSLCVFDPSILKLSEFLTSLPSNLMVDGG